MIATPTTPPAQLPIPSADSLLAWAINHPAEIAAYLTAIRALRSLEINVTQDGVTKRFPVQVSGENAVVSIVL